MNNNNNIILPNYLRKKIDDVLDFHIEAKWSDDRNSQRSSKKWQTWAYILSPSRLDHISMDMMIIIGDDDDDDDNDEDNDDDDDDDYYY